MTPSDQALCPISRNHWLAVVAAVGLTITVCTANAQPVGDDPGSNASAPQAQTKPETDPKPTMLDAVERGVNRITGALETLKTEEKSTEEKQRAERDLNAQENMAYWAMWMFWSSIGSLILTSFGVLLITGTLVYTKRAAEAADKAARLTEQANTSFANNSALELRAYISVEPAGIITLIARDEGIGIVEVRNVGKLPARNVFVYCNMQICDDQAACLPVMPDTERVGRVIQPGASLRQGSRVLIPSRQICENGKEIFVWGVVYYYDGYGGRRFTRFCHRYPSDAHKMGIELGSITRESTTIIDADNARYYTEGNEAN